MDINIKLSNLKGNIVNLTVKKTDKVGDAKRAAKHTPIDTYIWKCVGEVLKDEETLESYGIENDDVINVSKKHSGGGTNI